MKTQTEFATQFKFDSANCLKVGVERECHLTDLDGRIVPLASRVVPWLQERVNGRHHCYGYASLTCQMTEMTQWPCDPAEIKNLLLQNQVEIEMAERALDFRRTFWGTAMIREHSYGRRYNNIIHRPSLNTSSVAYQTTAIHIFVGMPDAETALKVYNEVIKRFLMLCRLGYISDAKHLNEYNRMMDVSNGGFAFNFDPEIRPFFDRLIKEVEIPSPYVNWQDFYQRACHNGFTDNPERNWDFIRINRRGAIEFRMFDTTEDLDLVVFWAMVCHLLCQVAMNS